MPTTRNDVLHRWRQQRPMRQLYRFGASGRLQRGDTRTLLPQARASQANPENDRGRKYDAAGLRPAQTKFSEHVWMRSRRARRKNQRSSENGRGVCRLDILYLNFASIAPWVQPARKFLRTTYSAKLSSRRICCCAFSGQLTFPIGLAERPICPDCEGTACGWSGLQQINSTKTGTHLEPACEGKMSDSRPCAPPFAFGDATPRPRGTF